MIVKRIVALAAVLLTTSACSRLPIGPTAYSSLSPVTMPSTVAPLVQDPAIPVVEDAAPPLVVIPGTFKTPETVTGQSGVNPTVVLEASARSRMAWAPLRAADLLKPPAMAARSLRSGSIDVSETSSTAPVAIDKSAQTAIAARIYDREATMDRLVQGGRDAAKAICSGC